MFKKILITGVSGLLGSKMAYLFSRETSWETLGTYNRNRIDIPASMHKTDLANEKEVNKLVSSINPDVIIHTAALTGVDYCETHKEEAWRVNVDGTRNIAEIAEKINAKLIYISTDYVFDGEKGMYKENDQTHPVDYYGETKLEGEKVVKETCDGYLIVRPSVLYGWNPVKLNFVTWMIKELKEGNKINIVKDQFNTPTLADDLAELILEMIKKEALGIFHTSGSERISRFDFALKIAGIFELNKNLIKPTTSDKLNWIAKRPMDSSLDVSKISRIRKPLNVEDSLRRMRGLT
jgi:dTDP-4-dehydrorhamnose reductase